MRMVYAFVATLAAYVLDFFEGVRNYWERSTPIEVFSDVFISVAALLLAFFFFNGEKLAEAVRLIR